MKPPDDRFKLVDYEREGGGTNCLALVLVAAACALLITIALYSWDVFK